MCIIFHSKYAQLTLGKLWFNCFTLERNAHFLILNTVNFTLSTSAVISDKKGQKYHHLLTEQSLQIAYAVIKKKLLNQRRQ